MRIQVTQWLRAAQYAGLALVVVLLSVGCQPGKDAASDANVKLEFEPSPPTVGMTDVTLTMTDSSGRPLGSGDIQLEGNMNHAGMKPVFSTLKETEPGRYEGTLEFTMGGDWFILVTGRLPDGHRVNEKIDVPGVKSP